VVMKRIAIGLFVVAFAGCSATGGGPGGPGDFPAEGGSDPGLSGSMGSRGGSEASTAGLGTIYFEFDRSALRGDARATLQGNAEYLRRNPRVGVEIQGNCDERGSQEYNLALGMRRAEAAKRYLVDLGIEAARLRTISFGEENPAARGSGESVWAKNRRDDFVVAR
jgi:peptidoglycan-associated lipoprotein